VFCTPAKTASNPVTDDASSSACRARKQQHLRRATTCHAPSRPSKRSQPRLGAGNNACPVRTPPVREMRRLHGHQGQKPPQDCAHRGTKSGPPLLPAVARQSRDTLCTVAHRRTSARSKEQLRSIWAHATGDIARIQDGHKREALLKANKAGTNQKSRAPRDVARKVRGHRCSRQWPSHRAGIPSARWHTDAHLPGAVTFDLGTSKKRSSDLGTCSSRHCSISGISECNSIKPPVQPTRHLEETWRVSS